MGQVTHIREGAIEAADGGAPRRPKLETVEFGSGWYHDAAISDADQASPRHHRGAAAPAMRVVGGGARPVGPG